jgi:hypothetical protein
MEVPTKVDLHVCHVTSVARILRLFPDLAPYTAISTQFSPFELHSVRSLHTPRANAFHIPRVENFDSRFEHRPTIL